jgi:hypothetical protein
MCKDLKSIKQRANLSRGAGAMETGNHSKNGVNLQNLSRAGEIVILQNPWLRGLYGLKFFTEQKNFYLLAIKYI